MRAVCQQCSRVTRRPLHKTVTGRLICDACWTTLQGASAAVIAGGGPGEAIATAGWLARIKATRRRSGG